MSGEKKEYPNSEIYEKAFIIKLFHNEKLRELYLDDIQPAVFLDRKKRLAYYLMKRLKDAKLAMSIENMIMFCSRPDDHLVAFMKKHQVTIPDNKELYDLFYDSVIDTQSNELFEYARRAVIEASFTRFVENAISEMKYYNGYNDANQHHRIVAQAKGIISVHKILYNGNVAKRDQLKETKDKINSKDEYISTSSQQLNSVIGGFTRGFVDAVIGKSSHGKSTWVDYNILHTLASGKVSKIIKITPEEDASTQMRRYLSMICKLSMSRMHQKLLEITDEHIEMLKKALKGKLVIYDSIYKYQDILELLRVADGEQIYVDHLQSIDYPGHSGILNNMIQNIPGLILHEERIAKRKNISIINLSQVGDKEIARSDRMSKRPRYHDAYGSSVLYQKAREFLAVYYPYKDYDENPHLFYGDSAAPTKEDFEIGIEKSSFSTTGIVRMKFDPEYCIFSDKQNQRLKTDYEAKSEKPLGQEEMFK